MKHRLRQHFFMHRAGTTAVEYAMVAALISITIIAGAGAIGAAMNGKFEEAGGQVASIAP